MSNTPTQAQLEAEYKLFTDAIERHVPISSPAQKPASVPGGSGAALVGTPVITPFHVVGPVRPIRRVAAFEHPLQFDLVRDEFRFGYDAFEPLDAPHYVCTGSARCIGPGDWLLDDGRLGRRG